VPVVSTCEIATVAPSVASTTPNNTCFIRHLLLY
jgi:hypothetical protein